MTGKGRAPSSAIFQGVAVFPATLPSWRKGESLVIRGRRREWGCCWFSSNSNAATSAAAARRRGSPFELKETGGQQDSFARPHNARQLMAGLLARAKRQQPRPREGVASHPMVRILRYAERHLGSFDFVHCVTALQGIASSVAPFLRAPQTAAGRGCGDSAEALLLIKRWELERKHARLNHAVLDSDWRRIDDSLNSPPRTRLVLPRDLHPLLLCLYSDAAFLALREKLVAALAAFSEEASSLPSSLAIDDPCQSAASPQAPALSLRSVSACLWSLGTMRVCDASLLRASLGALHAALLFSSRNSGDFASPETGKDVALSVWGVVSATRFADGALILQQVVDAREGAGLRRLPLRRGLAEQAALATRSKLVEDVERALAALVERVLLHKTPFEAKGIAAVLWGIAKARVYIHPEEATQRRNLESALIQRQAANLRLPLQQLTESAERQTVVAPSSRLFFELFEASFQGLAEDAALLETLENRQLATCLLAAASTMHPAKSFVQAVGKTFLRRAQGKEKSPRFVAMGNESLYKQKVHFLLPSQVSLKSSITPPASEELSFRDVADALFAASVLNCFPSTLFRELPARLLTAKEKDRYERPPAMRSAPLHSLCNICFAFQRFVEAAQPGALARLQLGRVLESPFQRRSLRSTWREAARETRAALRQRNDRRERALLARGLFSSCTSSRRTPARSRGPPQGLVRTPAAPAKRRHEQGRGALPSDAKDCFGRQEERPFEELLVARRVWSAVAAELSARLAEMPTCKQEASGRFSFLGLSAAVRALSAVGCLDTSLFERLRKAALELALPPLTASAAECLAHEHQVASPSCLAIRESKPRRDLGRVKGRILKAKSLLAQQAPDRSADSRKSRDRDALSCFPDSTVETLLRPPRLSRAKVEPSALLETRDFLVRPPGLSIRQ